MPTKFIAALLSLFLLLCLCGSPAQAQLGSSGFFLSQGSACQYPLPIGSDTVAAAYGLRLLRSAYSTPTKLVRVQRTSDNTQSDIGVAVNGCDLDSSAFNTFCAATTCFVAKWYDQSGNTNDVSQATFANMPQLQLNQQNGHPGINFNGTTDYLNATLGVGVSTASYLSVYRLSTSPSVSSAASINFGTDGFNDTIVGYNGGCLALRSVANVTSNGTKACPGATWYRVGTIMTNVLSRIYVNGLVGTDSTTSYTLATGTNLTVGAGVTPTFGIKWQSQIAEMIIFSPSISDADLLTISSNQGTYWGL